MRVCLIRVKAKLFRTVDCPQSNPHIKGTVHSPASCHSKPFFCGTQKKLVREMCPQKNQRGQCCTVDYQCSSNCIYWCSTKEVIFEVTWWRGNGANYYNKRQNIFYKFMSSSPGEDSGEDISPYLYFTYRFSIWHLLYHIVRSRAHLKSSHLVGYRLARIANQWVSFDTWTHLRLNQM